VAASALLLFDGKKQIQMKKFQIALFSAAIAGFIAGCGSKITENNYDKVKEGMTKNQVVAILGEPTEIEAVGQTNGADIKGPVWEGNGYKVVAIFSADDKLQTKRITKW
jgi:hypothetical protein